MRVGVVQLCSSDEVGPNLTRAESFVDEAAGRGCELIALPENFAYLRHEGQPIDCAQTLDGQIAGALSSWAARHSVWLLGGTFAEQIPGDTRVHNTATLFAPDGSLRATYRKIHLFDVELAGRGGAAYRESDSYAPGSEVVVADTPFGGLGLSVCYDLRFPEQYRLMVERGARMLAVPSAFTPETGKDHWEVLLRARAIENQAYVIAPAQCGRHSPTRASHGRSLIVDPWGLVIAQGGDAPALLVADCDPAECDRVRAAIPALRNRRL